MVNRTELHERARERIRCGALPNRRARAAWGGSGSETACALCDRVIHVSEIEYEIGMDGQTYRFHLACHEVWEWACGHPVGATQQS